LFHMPKLIILRGNSGSGKSTVAKALFERATRTKPNKNEWSEADMKDLYNPNDVMGYEFEHIIDEKSSKDETINKIKKVAGI
jgi:adenylate kinase family enzyme